MYKIDLKKLQHSPRPVRFWECCLAVFNETISTLAHEGKNVSLQERLGRVRGDRKNHFLDEAFNYFVTANSGHMAGYKISANDKFKQGIFESKNVDTQDFGDGRNIIVHQLSVDSSMRLRKPLIAVANTEVVESNIIASIRGRAIINSGRTEKLRKIFQQTREEGADILLFPECFVPNELLDRIVKFAVNEQTMVVTGLEHIKVGNYSYNFIVTVLPFKQNGIKDAVVSFRLKNHYSHGESHLITANHLKVPIVDQYVYDLFIWRGIYFSNYYCFELADVLHRSLFKGKIDLLVASEWNPDVNYFSNIVESISRDIHVFVAQVNTSQYGDTRITRPSKTESKDILKLKGGENDTILTGKIDIGLLREFQRELYPKTKDDKNYKPLPPDFLLEHVMKRINGKPIFT